MGLPPEIAPYASLTALVILVGGLMTGLLITKGHATDLRDAHANCDKEKSELRAGMTASTEAIRAYAGSVAAGFEKLDQRLASLERRRA